MTSSNSLRNHADIVVGVDSAPVVAPSEPANFLLTLNRAEIANFSRIGNDLTIELRGGRSLRIEGFFKLGNSANNLILVESGGRVLVDFQAAWGGADGITEPAVIYQGIEDDDKTDALWAFLGAAGIGLLASSAGGGGGGGGYALPIAPPGPPTSPAVPTLAIAAHGNPVGGGQSINDATPVFTGTAKPGSTVTVYDNGQAVGSTVTDIDGNWSFTLGTPLADGRYDLTAVATDSTGSSDPSPPQSIDIDTVAPDAPVIATVVDDMGAVTGLVTAGRPTDDATPVLSGSAEAGAQVSIFDGDTLLGVTTADANGQWTFTPPSELSEGAHPLHAVAADSAGNVSGSSAGFELTVDTTAPITSVSVVDPDGDNIPTVSGAVSEPGSTVTVTWPDGSTAQVPTDPTTGAWTATAAAPQPSGSVSAAATDAAGNVGPGASAPWTSTESDTTPPDTGAAGTTVTVGAIAGDGVVNSAEATGSVAVMVTLANVPADAASSAVTVVVDGVRYTATDSGGGTWSAQLPGAALAAAANTTVTAEATFSDVAGNTSAPISGSQGYAVDTTAPTTSVAVSDPEGDNIPTVSGTVSEPGSTVTVTWPDGGTSRVPTDSTTGAWTATATAPQPSGPVSAAATDAAGNAGPQATTPWTSTETDTTPPDTDAAGTTITVGAITSDGVINSAEASGNVAVTVTLANVPADAASTAVTVVVDGVRYAATDSGGGTWTAQVPGAALAAAAPPTVTAEATFSDVAGNTSAPISGSQGYAVDITAPTTTVVIADPEGDNIPTVSGTASEPGSTVTVTWPDGSTAQVPTDPTTGAWTATAGVPQPSGPVSAAATDAAGNAGPAATTPWTSTETDTTPPDTDAAGTTITVGAITSDGVVNSAEASGNVAVTVTLANVPADAASSAVTVVVDGVRYTATDSGGGTWTAQVPGAALAAAANTTVTAEATFSDVAGNTSTPISGSQGYAVDITAPTTTVVISDPEGDNIPTVSGTASEPGSTVTVTWPDGSTTQVPADPATGAWTATAAAPQPSGPVSAAATDAAGNVGPEASTPWTFTETDTTPPDTDAAGTTISVGTIAGDGVVNSAEALGNVAVTVTLANVPADAATTTVTVVVDGVRYTATDSGSGTWTAQVPGAALAAAANPTVTAEATFSDASGNTSAPISGSQGYAVDTTAPTTTVVISDPEGDNIPTISGTASEPGSTVTVTWPDSSTTQVPADPATGAWTATAAAPQPSGPVSAAATDAAGNVGPEASTPWTSTETDTTPPDTDAAGTTITVGAIASDGVVNSAEATGSVAVMVTLANVPADAASSTVAVVVDGVRYTATDSGSGTWTAQVPGAALAAAANPTV
ncbi:MAG: BapA prefix-like domain-containing protein, partial [Comamonadaceae bacterium]